MQGYEFCGIDQRGFGHSGGLKGRVESLDVQKADIQKFTDLYLQKYGDQGNVPKFMLGHSLGGLI